jgi:hypothetical protein
MRKGLLTPQKKCLTKMTSCRLAFPCPPNTSLNGVLTPCASNTTKSPTLFKTFSEGKSLLTSTFPEKSSSSFSRTGVVLLAGNAGESVFVFAVCVRGVVEGSALV